MTHATYVRVSSSVPRRIHRMTDPDGTEQRQADRNQKALEALIQSSGDSKDKGTVTTEDNDRAEESSAR